MRLERKYEGPCPVLKKVGRASYKIDIPTWMKIHHVIHVSNLKPYHEYPADPTRNQPTRGLVRANKQSSKEPKEILAKKEVVVSEQCRMEYLVKWKNLGDDETSQERANDLKKL